MTQNTPPASEVQFQGPGPFYLPVVQSAFARGGSDGVTIHFRIVVSPRQIETVYVQMVKKVALELAEAITRVASE